MRIRVSVVLLLVALAFVAGACATTEANSRPVLASSEVVVLSHQRAADVAAQVCGILHGAPRDAQGLTTGGCSLREHKEAHRHEDGSTHVSMTPDPETNSIVLVAPPGREQDLARAVALVRELDTPNASGAGLPPMITAGVALACECAVESTRWTEVSIFRPPDVDRYSKAELIERARAQAEVAEFEPSDPDCPHAYVADMRFGGARACVDYLNEIVDVHRRKAGSTDLQFYPPSDKHGLSTASVFLATDAYSVVAVEGPTDRRSLAWARRILDEVDGAIARSIGFVDGCVLNKPFEGWAKVLGSER